MAITGNGNASKEQVADLLRRYLNISPEQMFHLMPPMVWQRLICHFLQMGKPIYTNL